MAMSKKTFMAAIIISALLILIVSGLQAVEMAKANPIAYGPPRIAIVSPQYGITYNSSQVTLYVGIQLFGYTYTSLEVISWARFAIDNGITASLNLDMPTVIGPGTMINSTNIISNLSDGNHTINIFLETSFGESANANVTFITDAKPSPTPSTSPTLSPTPTITASPSPTKQPKVSILNPLNDSFFNVSLGGVTYQLTYETNSTLSWVGYSIDGSDNVTVTGNSTFVHDFVSSNGYHTLTVYANDTSGNWAIPQSVTYLVNFYPDYTPTPSPSPTQQPTLEPNPSVSPIVDPPIWFTPNNVMMLLGVLVAIAVVLCLFLYLRRVKKQ
jgi:hypothetical protein